jgi:hypothetical protein
MRGGDAGHSMSRPRSYCVEKITQQLCKQVYTEHLRVSALGYRESRCVIPVRH